MQYAQQPQNILAVIYDGCIIFKQSIWRLWPLCLALFLIQAWVLASLIVSYTPSFDYHLSGSMAHELFQMSNMLLSAVFVYLVLAMMWAAIDGYIRHGLLDWSGVFACLRRRGLAVVLQWIIVTALTLLGYVLLVVPALVVYVLFYQARFYVFLDGLGVIHSIKESAQLVWGTSWWRTFSMFALIAICAAAFLYGIYKLQPHMRTFEPFLLYVTYAGIGVVGVLLEVLFASWQLALFNDLKLRWVLPAAEGSVDGPAT